MQKLKARTSAKNYSSFPDLVAAHFPVSMLVCGFQIVAQYRGWFQFSNIAMSEPCLEFLTVGDLAPWLRVKRSTLYGWAATGKISCVKLNGAVRFIRADIERWIHDRARQAVDVPPSTPQVRAHTPPSISRVMLKQAGTRILERAKDRPATPRSPTSIPPHQNRKRIA